ncbi:MAG: hypothetical protein ABFS56_32295 [Pseudomonadota bacterium]
MDTCLNMVDNDTRLQHIINDGLEQAYYATPHLLPYPVPARKPLFKPY